MWNKLIFSGRKNIAWHQLGNESFKTLIWHLILMLSLIELGNWIHTLCNFWFAENIFCFGLSVFSHWPAKCSKQMFVLWVLKMKKQSNKRIEEKYFQLIKNQENIVRDHLKLYYYYINKAQKLVVMYLAHGKVRPGPHIFAYFRPGPHVSFKHSRCPMMGEVSLET